MKMEILKQTPINKKQHRVKIRHNFSQLKRVNCYIKHWRRLETLVEGIL